MHVVVAVTPAHPARQSLSKRRNQPATWFQLATVRLTILDKRLIQIDRRRDRAQNEVQ
jgi:hypothetical protein